MSNLSPIVYVFVAFVATLAAYVMLRMWADEGAGPIDEALLILVGAVAGVAAPRSAP